MPFHIVSFVAAICALQFVQFAYSIEMASIEITDQMRANLAAARKNGHYAYIVYKFAVQTVGKQRLIRLEEEHLGTAAQRHNAEYGQLKRLLLENDHSGECRFVALIVRSAHEENGAEGEELEKAHAYQPRMELLKYCPEEGQMKNASQKGIYTANKEAVKTALHFNECAEVNGKTALEQLLAEQVELQQKAQEHFHQREQNPHSLVACDAHSNQDLRCDIGGIVGHLGAMNLRQQVKNRQGTPLGVIYSILYGWSGTGIAEQHIGYGPREAIGRYANAHRHCIGAIEMLNSVEGECKMTAVNLLDEQDAKLLNGAAKEKHIAKMPMPKIYIIKFCPFGVVSQKLFPMAKAYQELKRHVTATMNVVQWIQVNHDWEEESVLLGLRDRCPPGH